MYDSAIRKKVIIAAIAFVVLVVGVSAFFMVQQNSKPVVGDEYLLKPRQDLPANTQTVFNLQALSRSLSLTTDETRRINLAFQDFVQKDPAIDYVTINLDSVKRSGNFNYFTLTTDKNLALFVEEENGYTTIKQSEGGPTLYVSARD